MFLLPLAAMLLVGGPSTSREWLCLVVALALCCVSLASSSGLADQVANAAAVLMTGGFIVLSASDRRPAFTRAAWAVVIAVIGVCIWCAVWGIAWTDIELALTRQWWEFTRLVVESGRLNGGVRTSTPLLDRLADLGRPMAQLFPARVVVSGMLALVLAAFWHERIAGRSFGRATERLANFRFTDHLVWLLIVAIAVLILPEIHLVQSLANRSAIADMMLFTVQYWEPAASNVLIVCAVLYAARGAAVASRFISPGPAIVLLVVATIFLLPFTIIGLASIGLADTWVDFRKMGVPVAG